MQLLRKLFRNRSQCGRNHKIRGLSTAELVGIIIIVGILGALGGTYIGSLVGSANKNSINQNIQGLNTVCASMLAGGVALHSTSGVIDSINGVAVTGDTATSSNALINAINTGVVDTTGVTYQMNPPISASAIANSTYVDTASTADGTGTGVVTSMSWAVKGGATPVYQDP